MIDELIKTICKLGNNKVEFLDYNLHLYYWGSQVTPSLHLDKKHNNQNWIDLCENTIYCSRYNTCNDDNNCKYKCKDLYDYENLDLVILKLEEIILMNI